MSTKLISHLLDTPTDGGLAVSVALGVEFRLLQRSAGNESYSLHRLVGEVRRGELPLEQRQSWVDAICNRLGNWFEEQRDDFSRLIIFESEIDHLKKWQENAEQFAPSHASRLMWLQGYPAYHRARYVEARNYVVEAHNIFEHLNETNSTLQANLLNDLGATGALLGEYDSVLPNFLRALSIRHELYGERHEDIATLLESIGWFYGEKGHYQRAIEYSQQALAMRRELFGESHRWIAESLTNLGRWFGELGDLQRAVTYSEQALAMRRQLFGPTHPAVANSLGHVGVWYAAQGNLDKALEFSKQSIAMLRELFGERHPDLAASLHNVGLWYGKQGDKQRKLEYAEQALTMYREIFGERSSWTAKSALQVANALKQLNRRDEAYSLARHFLNLSLPSPASEQFKHFEAQLLAKPIRPGFRQQAKTGKRKSKKKRR
jgi:tetratricopeptide (TPR) repeat protein